MPLRFTSEHDADWSVRKIAVVGPGIVGMPMAALLAHARIREGHDAPARVVVVQRDSPTSGWRRASTSERSSLRSRAYQRPPPRAGRREEIRSFMPQLSRLRTLPEKT